MGSEERAMLIIRTNGTIEDRKRKISLPAAQKIVGGYVEVVRLPIGVLLVDEDACMKREKPPGNENASRLAGQVILGDAIYMENLSDLT
jgi:hypothetical protein